jgi:hypothetical protein
MILAKLLPVAMMLNVIHEEVLSMSLFLMGLARLLRVAKLLETTHEELTFLSLFSVVFISLLPFLHCWGKPTRRF